jgi:protein-S-isoprenylcysteine O-methyltransferase
LSDLLRKLIQIVAAWTLALAVFGWWWPPVLRINQVWVVVAVSVAANLLQPSYRLSEGSPNALDRGTAAQILWTVYLSQALALTELCWRRRVSLEWGPLALAAALLMVSGLLLRTWAVRTLGQFFTMNIEVASGQSVVSSGPYRFVRHPSYTGAWITYVSSCIFLRSWIAAVVAAVALSVAFLRRVSHEESGLRASVPGYAAYCERRGRFLPRWFGV